MKYDFDEVIERRNTSSIKWAGSFLQSFGLCDHFDDDTIPMFIADMDFQCPQPVLDALHRVVDEKIFGYSFNIYIPEYYQAIIRWFRDKRHWTIKPEEIIYVNGTVEALKYAVRTFSSDGDGIIIQRPVYGPFSSTITETNRRIVDNHLVNDKGYYTIDFDDLERKARDPGNKMLILCNPHNPVGRVWTKDELGKVADICRKNGIIIVSDEIHGDILAKNQEFHPIACVADNSNIITCTAITKSFNLAGLQCTNVVIANEKLREKFAKAVGMLVQSSFSIAALIAAYNEGDEWLEQVNDYINGNIDWAISFLQEKMPKLKCFRPEGTYFLWMDFSAYGLSKEEIRNRITGKAKVIYEDGTLFDPEGGAAFVRICAPARRAFLQEAFARIAKEFES